MEIGGVVLRSDDIALGCGVELSGDYWVSVGICADKYAVTLKIDVNSTPFCCIHLHYVLLMGLGGSERSCVLWC